MYLELGVGGWGMNEQKCIAGKYIYLIGMVGLGFCPSRADGGGEY